MTGTSEHRLISFDETPIFYRRVRARDPRATLFILHGMGEHGARYLPLASYLAEAGVDCWMPDHRGFGKSGGKRGHAEHFEDLKKDVAALTSLAGRENGALPQFYLGHSFGGLVASAITADGQNRRLKGLVLSSPLFGLALQVPAWKEMVGYAASLVLPGHTENNGVNAAFLTHDPEELKAHAADPLIHLKISARLYTELIQAMLKSGVYATRILVPTLVLQAGDDRIVSREKTLTFYERLVAGDKDLEVYPGWYHEILHEVKRQQVYERIRAWVIKRI